MANWPWRGSSQLRRQSAGPPARSSKVRTHRRILDFFGGGYVAMAIEDLKLPPNKIDTIADFEAVKRFGVQSKGGADAATAAVLAELAAPIARGKLEVPIPGVFPLHAL